MAGMGNPVVVGRRPLQPDLDLVAGQAARNGGAALQQTQQNIVMGAGADPVQEYLRRILQDFDIEIYLKTFGRGWHGESISLTPATPARIISKAKSPRGYLIINPAEIAGFAPVITLFSSALRVPATYTSSTFNVSAVENVEFFLDITAVGGASTLIVNLQTQDPLTSNWATSQADIFAGAATVGTYYAMVGGLGLGRVMRLQAVVGAANVTFSISGVQTGNGLPVGANIYIGPSQDVNVTTGFSIMPGQKEYVYLLDDVEAWAITPTDPLTIKVLHLQG